MKIVAIIPARGGSKSVPRKNIKELAGKPLIAYTIESALKSKQVDNVIVSTNDQEIATISEEYKATVVKRPDDISGDDTSSEAALLYTLDYLKKNKRYEPSITVFLQCTSPLTLPEDIDGGIQTLLDNNADSVFSVTPFHHFLWGNNKNGEIIGFNHDKNTRELRQNRELQYLETGSFYTMKTQGFIRAKHRFFGKIITYEIHKERSIEIDDPIDFYLAELLINKKKTDNISDQLPDKVKAVIFDFDGVFTDNKVIIFEDGQESVICNRGDGFGIEKIRKFDIHLFVISNENNTIIKHRCKKLKINCSIGIENKLSELKNLLSKNNIDPLKAIYVGNDENDVDCMKYVGCPVSVNDAVDSVKQVSKIILSSNGGNGAVREICELVLRNLISK